MPVSVSGLSSNIDTDSIVKQLVELEKKPLIRLQEEKEYFIEQKNSWTTLDNKLKELREIAKELYGFKAVFKEKKGIVENEEYFTATPERTANISKKSIEILQLASGHNIFSDPVKTDERFEGFEFEIKVGDKKSKIDFSKGGTLQDLASAINRDAKDIVIAEVSKPTENTSVLNLKAIQTGEKNKIEILENTKDKFFDRIGMTQQIPSSALFEDFKNYKSENLIHYNGPEQMKDSKDIDSNIKIDSALILVGNTWKEYPLKLTLKLDKSYYLAVKVKIEDVGVREQQIAEAGNLIIKRIDSVQIKDIEILGSPYEINKIEGEEPTVLRYGIGIAKGDGPNRQEMLFDIKRETVTNFTQFSFNIGSKLNEIDRIIFYNDDKQLKISFKDLKIYSEETGVKQEYKNELSQPKDAKLKIDGVEISRPQNSISDAIPGVNLNLKNPTKSPQQLQITYDIEKSKDKIDKFVKQYNDVMKFIQEQAYTPMNTKPGEYQKSKQGLLAGDMVLANIQSKLRSLVIKSYPTSLGERLALLAQIGITTGKPGSPWSDIKEGYLKIDNDKLQEMLTLYSEQIGDLFGYDTNNDKIIDNGCAYSIDNTLNFVVQPKGLINNKIELIKTRITQQDKSIERKEKDVENYEKELRKKFANMEKSLAGLKAIQERLDQQIESIKPKSSKENK